MANGTGAGVREWITGLLLPLAILAYTVQKDRADGRQRALDRVTAIIHSLGSDVEGERSMARSYIAYLGHHGEVDPEIVELLRNSVNTATTPAESAAAVKTLESLPTGDAKAALKGIPGRLYVEIRSDADRPTALEAQKRLASELTTPGIEVLNTGPEATEVRYYYPADKAHAQDLANRLIALGIPATPKDVSAFARKTGSTVAEKTFELWLAPGAKFKNHL